GLQCADWLLVDVGVWGWHQLSWSFPGGMTRVLQPELLDELPSNDPRAVHSRRDLRRINKIMGNARPVIKFLRAAELKSPITIAEIGAGDGNISAQIATALSAVGVLGTLLLVDRQPLVASEIRGWKVHRIEAEVFAFLEKAAPVDVIIANLFLHHFTDEQLREMFQQCARLCNLFAASEPRRSSLAMWLSRRVRLIGCTEVTRHDAEISVRAGFTCTDLSKLWPDDAAWRLTERKAGLFTHFFGARRIP
ncbi:MAG TPA: methyltransferase domain-containing protein, partial [Verrucomicrobiae bacterium]|nr:methyltransferase domain-containing protein [Verrucomicrobiae bacterium]